MAAVVKSRKRTTGYRGRTK